jgi:hypothetical protein
MGLIRASREVCQSFSVGPSSAEDSRFKKHSIVARKHAFAFAICCANLTLDALIDTHLPPICSGYQTQMIYPVLRLTTTILSSILPKAQHQATNIQPTLAMYLQHRLAHHHAQYTPALSMRTTHSLAHEERRLRVSHFQTAVRRENTTRTQKAKTRT